MSKLELEIYFYLMTNGPEHINLLFIPFNNCGLKEYLGAIKNLIENDYIKNEENILTPL